MLTSPLRSGKSALPLAVAALAPPCESKSLTGQIKRNKVSYDNGNEYNKRWQFKWKHAYYTYPRENLHTRVMRPEETKTAAPIYGAWIADFCKRFLPGMQNVWDRRHRCYDTFNVYFLPGCSILAYQFWPLAFGFKLLTILPLCVLYTRVRDRTLDPDLKETYPHFALL
jgi:hypothetical protein